jgi:nitrous oxidase accessory protein NosD
MNLNERFSPSATGATLKTIVATALAAGAALTVAFGSATPAEAAPRTLWVKRGAGCTDTGAGTTAARPFCTITRAAKAAKPGTTIMIKAGRYGVLAPRVSGTPRAPITFKAAQRGVVITANGRPVAVNVDKVHDVKFQGMTITGAARQGVWVGSSARITFTTVTVKGNRGPGVQVRKSTSLTISRSTISGNKLAGIMEVGGNRATLYSGNRIEGNGRDHRAFNGDGIILSGRGAVVRGNRISSNGDHKLYEHGIYASKAAAAYLIERNTLSGNSATGVKAQGTGTVRSNTFGSSRFGIYVDTRSGVRAYGNTFKGSFAKPVATASGAKVVAYGNKVTR